LLTEGISFLTDCREIHRGNQTYVLLIKCSNDIDFMNYFNDKETTENTDPKDDKLLFLNGKERLKYLRGKRDYQRKKNKVRPVIQYLMNLIKF
jgi:hypothetical protein